jgi:hypothetical protein
VKTRDIIIAFDDLKDPTASGFDPINQFAPVAVTSPNQLNDTQDQANRVHNQMSFAAIELFTGIITAFTAHG